MEENSLIRFIQALPRVPGAGTPFPAANIPARISTNTLPVEKFIAPVCVIDVSRQAGADPDFLLTLQHVESREGATGALRLATARRDVGPCPPSRS